MKLDIDVYESLCGMKRAVKTLDNREITISTRPGEVIQMPTKSFCFYVAFLSVSQVIKQADIKMVLSEGMPTHKDPFNKGKLIVLFNITFPEKLDPSVAKKLSTLLPKPKLHPDPAGAE